MSRSARVLAAIAAIAFSSSPALAAGFIEVKLKKGKLLLKGDSQRNVIDVEKSDVGLRIVGKEGTLINGLVEVVLPMPDAIKIKLSGGDDHVHVGSIQVDDLKISTGEGDDTVYVHASWCTDDLRIKTGSGSDYVSLTQTEITDSMSIQLGSGDDGLYASVLDTFGKSKIRGGHGLDYAYLHSCFFEGNSDVHMGGSPDRLEVVGGTFFESPSELNGGQDFDYLYLGANPGSGLDVDNFESIDD